MSITDNIKRLLYRRLSLTGYLRAVSGLFFAGYRLGLARHSAAYEYPRFLKTLVREGDTVLDIGANLGYYSRILSHIVGDEGKVYAVEPVKPILGVLARNIRRCSNVEIVPYALGRDDRSIVMVNNSAQIAGYMGTGRNYIPETENEESADDNMEFSVEMRRGSELFGSLTRLDFIKCDVEGYESVVIPEMAPVIEKHLPVVLLETGGATRRDMIDLLRGWGYAGYVLASGRLVSVVRTPKSANITGEKDIVFIPGHRHNEILMQHSRQKQVVTRLSTRKTGAYLDRKVRILRGD